MSELNNNNKKNLYSAYNDLILPNTLEMQVFK